MLVSYEWLNELIDTGLGPDETSRVLTMAGLEVEGTESSGSDTIFEVNVTPNRPDCLSILGIARELAALTGKSLKTKSSALDDSGGEGLKIVIDDPELCRRYAGRVIKGVSLGDSPAWLSERLEKCGIRSINNIVDITNYILLELGHPLHAFDLGTLRGQMIRVAVAGDGNSIVTLDGTERKLPSDALLIWDAERPVAVAGVMGGADTEVSDSTTDVFLESAWFKPESVRRTSKTLGLSTEASYRFERGADIVMVKEALDRAAALMAEIAGGTVENVTDNYPLKFVPSVFTVKYDKVNRILGTTLSNEEIANIVRSLQIEVLDEGDRFSVTQQSYRPDMTHDYDVIEEVARLYGYNNISTSVPRADISSGGTKGIRKLLIDIKALMMKSGYHEAVNYSFMNPSYLDILSLPEDDERRSVMRVLNPLRQEDSLMRTMLVHSLIDNCLHNMARGVEDVRLVEISKVFINTGKPLPDETWQLGGIYYKKDVPELWKENAGTFFVAKGAIESLLNGLKISNYEFSRSKEPFLHPGRSADIHLPGGKAGYIGVLSPSVMEKLDVAKRGDIVVFQMSLDAVASAIPDSIKYSPIPRYPAIKRDLALVLDEGLNAGEVISLIRDYPSELIEESSVFDVYRGQGVAAGKKSLAFNIVYRSTDRTLTDEEADSVHKELVSHIIKETGGEVRG